MLRRFVILALLSIGACGPSAQMQRCDQLSRQYEALQGSRPEAGTDRQFWRQATAVTAWEQSVAAAKQAYDAECRRG